MLYLVGGRSAASAMVGETNTKEQYELNETSFGVVSLEERCREAFWRGERNMFGVKENCCCGYCTVRKYLWGTAVLLYRKEIVSVRGDKGKLWLG